MSRYWINYEGNWSITKCRPTCLPVPTESTTSSIVSSTVSQLDSDLDGKGIQKLVFSSDLVVRPLDDGDLYVTVNSCSLAAGSLYVDMAMTAALEVYKRSDRGSEMPALELSSIVIGKCRNIENQTDTYIRVVAIQDGQDMSTVAVPIDLSYAGNADQLAECRVTFAPSTFLISDTEEKTSLYRSRMKLLELIHKIIFCLSAPTTTKHIGHLTELREVILNPRSRRRLGVSTSQRRLHTQSELAQYPASSGTLRCLPKEPTMCSNELRLAAFARPFAVWNGLPCPCALFRFH